MPRDSIRIGRVYGISVELHWTLVLLLLFSIIVSFLFFLFFVMVFVAVFLHELSHSVTALRNKKKVSRIVLNPLGGASMLDDTNIDPDTEFKISIVGPLSNFLLAGISAIAVVFAPIGIPTELIQLFFLINVLLGVSNILPIFPMDGGRIFRSYLQKTRSKYDATMITAKLSKGLLGVIVIATLAFVLFETSYTLLYRETVLIWTLLIAVILYGGTQAEIEVAMLRKETQGLTVASAASKRFIYAEPDRKLSSLYSLIKDAKEHIVITRIGGSYCIAEINKARRKQNAVYVRDIAKQVPTIQYNTGVVDALAAMESSGSEVAVVSRSQQKPEIVTAQHLQTYISLHVIAKREKSMAKANKQGI